MSGVLRATIPFWKQSLYRHRPQPINGAAAGEATDYEAPRSFGVKVRSSTLHSWYLSAGSIV